MSEEAKAYIDDNTARKLADMLLAMKEKILGSPEGRRRYEEWHMKEYGSLPN